MHDLSVLALAKRAAVLVVFCEILKPHVLEPCDYDTAIGADDPIQSFAFFELVFETVLSHIEA